MEQESRSFTRAGSWYSNLVTLCIFVLTTLLASMGVYGKFGLGTDKYSHSGQIGAIYYKFWNVGGNWSVKDQKDAIYWAMDYMMNKDGGKWLSNTYYVTLKHRGVVIGYARLSPEQVQGPFKGTPEDIRLTYDIVEDRDWKRDIKVVR